MKIVCPICDGNGYILTPEAVPQYKKLPCDDCNGTGYINKPTGNYCPACGEPIAIDKKWCEFHKKAEENL